MKQISNGKVMTEEAGTISGELELQVENNSAQIRYAETEDWYAISGEGNGSDGLDEQDIADRISASADEKDEAGNAVPFTL